MTETPDMILNWLDEVGKPTKDELFQREVMGWIDEELNRMEIIPIAQDPFGLECQPIVELKLEWML